MSESERLLAKFLKCCYETFQIYKKCRQIQVHTYAQPILKKYPVQVNCIYQYLAKTFFISL